MGSVQDGSHEPVQASSSIPLAHTSNTQAREEQHLLHARLRLGALHTIYKGRKLRLRWVKKWGSDGARSRSLGCWIPKPGLIPPMWWVAMLCCPHSGHPCLGSQAKFPGFYHGQETQVLCPTHCKPCATSWPPSHLESSRTLPVQSRILSIHLSPKPGRDVSRFHHCPQFIPAPPSGNSLSTNGDDESAPPSLPP